jgi:hypothetical protein
LLSLPDNWVTHPRQVAHFLGISKNQIYTILKKLISSGYAIKKELKCEKGRFSTVEYYFYEERIEPLEGFKENSTVSQKRDTEKPDTEKGTLQKTYSLNKKDLTENVNPSLKVPKEPEPAKAGDAQGNEPIPEKRKKTPPMFSQRVRETATEMVNTLVKHNTVYRPPEDLTKFLQAVEDMIEKDTQDPELLLKVFEYAAGDNIERGSFSGWQGIISTNTKGGKVTNPAEIFRKHFAKIHSNMNSRPKRNFAPSSDIERMREAQAEMMSRSI